MTVALFLRRGVLPHKIDNGKRRVESDKEKQRDPMQFQEVKRAGIGEKVQNGKCLRFVEQEAVIKPGQLIGNQGDDKIQFGPQKRAQHRHWIWPIFVRQHQENYPDDDAGVRCEKAKESQVWKSEAQIRSEYGLQRPTNSPEICHLEPALISAPQRHDNNDHSPVTELQWQHLSPRHSAVTAHEN